MEISSNSLTDRRQEEFDLVCQARDNNDQRAFATLLNNYWDTTHLLLLRITHNETTADDLTMVAFSRAFSSLNTYTPKCTFGTWLFRIATNAGIDYLRRQNDSQTYIEELATPVDDRLVEYPLASAEHNPEEAIIHEQRCRMLRKAMEQLDPMYKDLVEMRYFEEMSYEEISKMLKIPLNTVRIRLHRAKSYLRTLLSAMDNGTFEDQDQFPQE